MSDVRAWAEVARKIPADAKAHASRDGDSFLKALRARVARAEMDAYSEATGEDVKGAYQVSMLATRERIDVVEGPWQAIWVAEGAAWAAGRVVDHSLTWEVAVQRAVGEAAMLLDSGKTIDDYARLEGYCAAAYAHDPSLGELAYRIAANPESAAARQLRAWYEQADSWALEKLGASEGASSSHAKLMLGKQRDAAFANAVRELAPAVESWRAERAAFIEGFSRSDSLAAAAWRSRRAHLEGNVAALSGTLPPDLSPAQISVSLGSTWVPADVVKDFVVQEVGLRFPFDADELDISYQAATAKWFVTRRAALSPKALEKWGTQRAHPIDILRSSLNCSRVVVKDDDPENDGKKAVNAAETAAAQAKQAALEERFADWCWEDEARAARLAAIYNERYNSIVPLTYHGADLKFPEMNPQIELRPWQRDAVARILYGKSGALLAHVVGAGKTMEFIAGAMESKRLGLCGKPMVVVPNHLVEQTAAAFTELYPAARVLAARKRDFEKERRREFTARVATGDWDAVVIGQSQFERIPLSSEARQAYISGQIERYQQADLAEREADGRKSRSVKEIAKARERLERKLDKLLDSSLKDDERGATFDMLGVDMLIVDEAHAYKNVELTTKMSRVAGVASAGSKRSEDMMSKVRWMQARHGERSVVFATGTPVSNSMVELYNMQRYLNPATLDSMGIGSFDEWATTFGRREAAFEITPEGGGYQMKERFSKFVNMPELMSAVETFADIKTASDVDLDLPECEVHAVAVEPTAEQKEAVEALIERAALVRDKKVAPEVDNMLKITGDGRKVALDARLLDPGSADDSVECGGKIAACAENVARIWRETAAERGCQLVFCDTSTPHSGRWNVYEELLGQLVAAGVDAADIAFVHDAGDKPEKKEELFARVRAGEVRVLIGSTEKMGTGTNVQDRLAATHDLDCPWRPADLEQRQGRILRQGNGYDKVDVYRYVCVGTFDSYLYQLVEGKQRFISQVFNRDPKVREVSDLDDAVTLSYAQMKAAAAGDDRIRERMELQNKVTRLSMLKDTHDSAVRRARELVERTLPARIEGLQKTLSDVQADLDELSTAEDAQGSWCGMTVGGEHFADKHDAGEALQRAARSLEAGASAILGEYRGLSVRAHMQQATGKPTIGLCGRLNWMTPNPIPVQPGRVPAALDRMAARIEKRAGEAAGALGDARAELAAARTRTEALFEHAAELEAARARIAELNVELGIEDEEAAAAAEQDAKARRAALAAERDAELDLKPLHGESADMKKRFVERFGFEPEFSNLELPGGEKPMRMDEVHAALVQLGLAARVGRGLSGEDGRRAAALAAYVELRAERGQDTPEE